MPASFFPASALRSSSPTPAPPWRPVSPSKLETSESPSSSGRASTPRVAATPPWDAPETPVASSQAPGSLITGVNLALEAFALESPSPVRPQAQNPPPTPDRGLRDRTNTPPRRAHFAPRPKRKRVPLPAL